jgi:predicted amidohydrolase|tara:strand:+ start:308 stop:1138 length:831 start_codon:yes stop_codon:yes gene_type:complete
MSIRIAAVQPRTFSGDDEAKNLDACLDYIDQAADAGAKFVCLPEMYPGPVHPSIDFDTTALYDKAAERQVYLIRGKREPAGDQHNVCAEVIGPDGKSVGLYRRTTPSGPYIYQDLETWSIDYAPADGLPVFETEFGKIGVLICSEVYVPELTRVLVLAGAKLIFYPSGGHINELMGTWKIMLQARAIENLIYTAACQNMYGVEEGVGMICGPEGVLAEDGGEAVIIADLDMEHLQWLRDQDEKLEMPKKYSVVPGTLRWRRPDLYGPLVAPPSIAQ